MNAVKIIVVLYKANQPHHGGITICKGTYDTVLYQNDENLKAGMLLFCYVKL